MSAVVRAERLDAGGRAAVGECPVWRAQEGALYWVDIPARRIVRLEIESARRTEWAFGEQVACFAFDAAGRVVAGMESGIFGVTLSGASEVNEGRVVKLAAPAFPAPGMRFNDGRCDRQGRFWAGTMVQDMSLASTAGALYRYDEHGTLSAPVGWERSRKESCFPVRRVSRCATAGVRADTDRGLRSWCPGVWRDGLWRGGRLR